MIFRATKRPIGHDHGSPPDDFLEAEIAWAQQEDELVFAINDNDDIYTLVKSRVGPYQTPLFRKAVLCEVLRVLPGDESDWHFNEGRDTTAGAEKPDEMEAGAFQVSYNSVRLGPDLAEFLSAHGIGDAATFQARMKSDPGLAFAYVARLLREPYAGWDGPINRGWIAAQMDRTAIAEFAQLLA